MNSMPPSEILRLAYEGWYEYEADAMEARDAAVRMVEREVMLMEPTLDKTGACVDMAAYAAGDPDNMLSFPVTQVSNVGSVVTICHSINVSAAVSERNIIRRGLVIAGLIQALDFLGHQTELWINDDYWTMAHKDERLNVRVRIKSAQDMIDPSRILYAVAHPGVLRGLGFRTCATTPGVFGDFGTTLRHNGFGQVNEAKRNLVEGTVYLPGLESGVDVPTAAIEVRRYLVQLGLIEGEDE